VSAAPEVILTPLTVGAVFLSEGIQTRQGVLEYGIRAAHRLCHATLLNLSTNRRASTWSIGARPGTKRVSGGEQSR
jgi:hypothetical protein